MEGLGLGGGVGAELGGQGLAEALVGGQGGGGLAGGGVGAHDGPPGGLVQGVGGGGGAGVGQGAGRVADGQGGLPGEPPGPGGQASGLAPGRHGPVGVGLVGQERAPSTQGQGALGGGQGQGGLAAEAGLGLAGQPFRLVQVDLDPGPGHEPPSLAVAGDGVRAEHGPQPAHQRGQVGVGVGGRAPAPQGLDQHLGRDDRAPPGQQQLQQGAALAAGQPWAGTSRPSTATASTPSTCTRTLPWRPIRRLWSIAATGGQDRPPPGGGPQGRPGLAAANRSAQRFQVSASSGAWSNRAAAAWSSW